MQTDKSVERPLHSLRVIEFEGIGPGPLAGRMLSDLGAHVIVVVRPTPSAVDRTLIGENTENPLRQGKEIAVGAKVRHLAFLEGLQQLGWTSGRKGARLVSAPIFARPRRRGDRIAPVSAAVQNVRFWHKADITRLSSDVRFRG